MRNPELSIRAARTISVVHAEAFQLMLYREVDGPGKAWFWNSRDGVTPFGTLLDGKQYRHAMQGYPTSYSAALPASAEHVWVSYDPASWADMMRVRWERYRDLPAGEWHDPAEFLERFPMPEAMLAQMPFEHGQPRQITREEFLASTPEWMGKADG